MKKAIVLAAGEGTRMQSNIPKVLHKVMGTSMIKHVVDELNKCDLEEIIVIVGHNKRDIIKELEDYDNIIFREQPIGEAYPYGTGFAVMQGIDRISDDDSVLIVCGDTPLLKGSTLTKLLDHGNSTDSHGTILTAVVQDSFGYGRVLKDENGCVKEIIEERDANEAEKKINEINSGVYTFQGKELKESLAKLDTDNAQGELYLTDVIRLINEDEKKVTSMITDDYTEITGVNSKRQLAEVESLLKSRINNHWMDEGVTIIDPNNTYIQKNVKIGRDTIIGPGVRLEGDTVIDKNVEIYGDTRILSSKIGDKVVVQSSYITESIVGNNVTIGPFAHLRPGCDIKDNVHIGNYAELKNSTVGKYTQVGHHSYIGDSTVGQNVNMGAGIITVNYDGINKYKTIIGDHAFIGSNSNLVAPVTILDHGYVAAGSTITKDVGSSDLAIGRSRQTVIKNWVKKNNGED